MWATRPPASSSSPPATTPTDSTANDPFAKLCGSCPIKANSGKTKRLRLNRGGDRNANAALWFIVRTRMVSHPPTIAYVERRTTEGLSKLDIMRCLKRYVARELYPYIVDVAGPSPAAVPLEQAA